MNVVHHECSYKPYQIIINSPKALKIVGGLAREELVAIEKFTLLTLDDRCVTLNCYQHSVHSQVFF